MQPRHIYKSEKQTIFDLLLQYGGALSGLFDFMRGNNLMELDIEAGDYIEPTLLNPSVAAFLNPKNVTVPVVVSGENIPLNTVTVAVNDLPLGVWLVGSTHDLLFKDIAGNTLSLIIAEDRIIIDMEIDFTLYQDEVETFNTQVPIGGVTTIDIDETTTKTSTTPLSGTGDSENHAGSTDTVIVLANGEPFSIWEVGTDHNILVEDSVGNPLALVVSGNVITILGIKYNVTINNEMVQQVTVPIANNEIINMI